MARTLTKEDKDRLKRAQNWKCANPKCVKSIKSGGHIHHKDGNPENNNIRNLIALCRKCHEEKTKKQMRKKKDKAIFPASLKI